MSESNAADSERLAHLVALGEEAYDRMYEVHDITSATACYCDAKEAFADAIGLAQRLGLTEEVEKLEKRLEHIKAVYRKQFWQG